MYYKFSPLFYPLPTRVFLNKAFLSSKYDNFLKNFIFGYAESLLLHMRISLVVVSRSCSLVAVCKFFIAVVSVVEHWL